MRVLLKNRRTGLYYAGNGDWTAAADAAHNFQPSWMAIGYARQQNLTETDLIFELGPGRQNIIVPVIAGLPPNQSEPRI